MNGNPKKYRCPKCNVGLILYRVRPRKEYDYGWCSVCRGDYDVADLTPNDRPMSDYRPNR